MQIIANGIRIEVEDSAAGDTSRPVVLLIMGLGMQLIAWPDAFVARLVEQGYRVLRMDNRDIGLSQHFDHLRVPNIVWASLLHRLRLPLRSPYLLEDLARDSLGVLDTLGIARAHVLGVSMGGMVAQRLALLAPGRLHSLCSVMSSSGAPGLPGAQPAVLRAMLSRPAKQEEDVLVAHYVRLLKLIGSPGFPQAEGAVADRIRAGLRRSNHPQGTLRQMVAIAAYRTRHRLLQQIALPTLVVHGRADPMVPFAHGVDTARRIPKAQFVGIDGMGHDLAPGVCEHLLTHVLPFWKAHAA